MIAARLMSSEFAMDFDKIVAGLAEAGIRI